jgi:hypothetical protein
MTATDQTVPARVDTRFKGGMAAAAKIDVRGLRRRLEETITGEVRFDTQAKGLYATDASNYRQVPIGVVVPKTLDDVVATIGPAMNSVRRSSIAAGAPACPGRRSTSRSSSTTPST